MGISHLNDLPAVRLKVQSELRHDGHHEADCEEGCKKIKVSGRNISK